MMMMMMERKIAQCHFFNGFQVKGGYGQFLSTFFTDVKETSKVCSQQEQQTTTTAGHWFREMNNNFCSIILGTIYELSGFSQKKVQAILMNFLKRKFISLFFHLYPTVHFIALFALWSVK